jgi:hypothetical protein
VTRRSYQDNLVRFSGTPLHTVVLFHCYVDELHYDSGLATGYWWKTSFSYIENMPAFVPIMFEMTVFFSAHLMVITFMRSKLWPFKQAENPDVRTTDDHFLMEVSSQ